MVQKTKHKKHQNHHTDAFMFQLEEGLVSQQSQRHDIPFSDLFSKFIAHPTMHDAMWSFKDHEYQIDIANATLGVPEVSVEKCSQVGLSELSIAILFILGITKSKIRVIHALPTKGISEAFVADRVNTPIENSPFVLAQVDQSMNNLSQKKLKNGTIFYFVGVEGGKSGISVPAPYLIEDEINFANQMLLNRLHSRQGHYRKEDTFTLRFSTPTIPDFAVSQHYNDSSKGMYGVKCNNCNKWQVVRFKDHCIIPGYDGKILELLESDLYNASYKIDDAYIQCPSCHKPISANAFLSKNSRQWIHEFPEKLLTHHGYKVQPQDVYSINTPAYTLWQLKDYAFKQEWVNFKLGEAYVDASSKLTMPALVNPMNIPSGGSYFLGIDVGKICWLTIGKKVKGRMFILETRSIRNEVDSRGVSSIVRTVLDFDTKYDFDGIIVDGMPDLTLSATIVALRPDVAYMCRYVERAPEVGAFNLFKPTGEVVTFRTEAFNLLAVALNSDMVKILQNPEVDVVKLHLGNFVKVVEDGVSRWVKTGEDHFAHSMLYMMMAANALGNSFKALDGNTVLSDGIICVNIGGTTNRKVIGTV